MHWRPPHHIIFACWRPVTVSNAGITRAPFNAMIAINANPNPISWSLSTVVTATQSKLIPIQFVADVSQTAMWETGPDAQIPNCPYHNEALMWHRCDVNKWALQHPAACWHRNAFTVRKLKNNRTSRTSLQSFFSTSLQGKLAMVTSSYLTGMQLKCAYKWS